VPAQHEFAGDRHRGAAEQDGAVLWSAVVADQSKSLRARSHTTSPTTPASSIRSVERLSSHH
jgi:hypothetical protein